ncbi:MAG: ATP-binding protein [Chloroflexi bacterium]|nr:ATP-binding protein [Chloroflexota bacterium]
MIKRPVITNSIQTALERSRAVALIGPRQCGKTTLARQFVPPDSLNYFDLEDPVSLARLVEPMTALRELRGLVVIDEIQRAPTLFPVLRVLLDRQPLPSKFLILGSTSPELIKRSSETLAGRIETITLGGFMLAEVGTPALAQHWLRGGFPLSFLAQSEPDSLAWRKNFVQTFLERDLPQLGVRIPATTLLRFWTMLAHNHGQIWNAAEFARALGIGETTVRRYLDLMEGVFMVRQLQPWHANVTKRQVKSPKIYLRDSGLLHHLLGIRSPVELQTHPKVGASWEGYAIEEIFKSIAPDEAYFWATHNGAELDLILLTHGKKFGVECKRVDAPRLTSSMRTALDDLQLDQIAVIYPGDRRYPISERITAVPLEAISDAQTLFSG